MFPFNTVQTPNCLKCKVEHSVDLLILALGQEINNNKFSPNLRTQRPDGLQCETDLLIYLRPNMASPAFSSMV